MHGSTCIFWANLTPCSLKHLGEALASGAAAETDVRAAAARLFALRFSVGEFDPPAMVPWYANTTAYGPAAYPTEFYGNASLEATRQSLTLLKNSGVLPLALPAGGGFDPCDGNTTDGLCGIAADTGFCCENLGAVPARSADECCASCQRTAGCVAWTLTGNVTGSLCWRHDAVSGGNTPRPSAGFTAGVVYSRLPPFPPCPAAQQPKVAVLGIQWFTGAGYDTADGPHPLTSEVLAAAPRAPPAPGMTPPRCKRRSRARRLRSSLWAAAASTGRCTTART